MEEKKITATAELEGGGSSWWYVCSECHVAIDYKKTPCPHCGAEVTWEGFDLPRDENSYLLLLPDCSAFRQRIEIIAIAASCRAAQHSGKVALNERQACSKTPCTML